LQRRIFSLLFLIAGVLLFQSAQAQTGIPVFVGPPLVSANGPPPVSGPTPGIYDISRDSLNAASGVLDAKNGGTINGIPGSVTLNLVVGAGAFEARMLHAAGPGSLINMTGVQLDINIPDGADQGRNRAAMAETGGTVILRKAAWWPRTSSSIISTSKSLESRGAHLGRTMVKVRLLLARKIGTVEATHVLSSQDSKSITGNGSGIALPA
jgi:hypothetical protein